MTDKKFWLQKLALKNGLAISDFQADQINFFANKIREHNKKINLISRRDEENLWSKHILASISFLFLRKFTSTASIVDIGTGGGFPGIPLAILCPSLNFVLIDSIKKKIHVVQSIVSELRLKNVTVVCGRAEELGPKKEFHERFEYVICRAVSTTKDILKWGTPFLKSFLTETDHDVKKGNESIVTPGSVILLKGGDLTNEIEEAKVKSQPRNIEVIPVIFVGSESSDLIDKKLVIVQP